MITHRETFCFTILVIIVTNISSAFRCPTNQACECQSNRDGSLEINCFMKNDTFFNLNIQPGRLIRIDCINSPEWSDFHLDVSSLSNNEIESMFFRMCDLPSNSSLGEITRMLGATDVNKLIFQSYKNLSFVLKKHHLDGFENLKHLILSSNNVSYLEEDLLANLPNLTFLNLRENNLYSIPPGFLGYTPKLQTVELGDNNLKSIEPGTFSNLKNLTLLNLWKNQIIEFRSGTFDGLVALKTLDINMNYINTLPEDIFATLENLDTINLSRNNFTHLPRDLLQKNTKLRIFNMFENKINMTTLPNEFFANLTKLTILKLRKNGFITLPEDLFWGCSSLTNISLERNYLKSLPVQIFRDSKKLLELGLSFNDFEKLPDNIFSNTNQLVKLDLSKNHITFLSKDLFNGLHALEELNMEQNQLMIISDESFSPLGHLKIARFSNNRLTLQPVHKFSDDYGMMSPFRDCTELEELYLANNSISQIFSDWIFSSLRLRQLDLKYNNILFLTVTDLQFISSDIKVDLTHNKIQRIFLYSAEKFTDYQQYPRNTIILVDNNPLHCDCELYEFLRYIEGRMHPSVQNFFHIIPGNLTCQSPEDLKDILVTDLKSKSLRCIVDDSNICSEKCTCIVKPENNEFIFNCSYRNLTRIPSDIKIPSSRKVELNLSGNHFTQMPDLKELLEPINKLILSHNSISEISLNGLSRTLKVLELHDNNISRIRPNVLESLKNCTNLTRLTLHVNPWECDCDAKDLLYFIQTEFVTKPDLLKVTCHGKNNTMSEMTTNEFCPLDTTAIVGICVAIAVMGLLIGTCGVFYFKYQRQIKVWLFAHQWCLWFVTEEELDKEKLYDAFVSYSHKDHDFVVNELVSKLEGGPKPFKLCLHYRDWLAGEWIPANIARSVEDSRRTIVVLSPNFLESVWGRMEFRAAHSQALSEGRARVILILYGNIGPTDDLDPELKAYISMNTYVKWGDPWFWDKLRYALPHQPKLARNSMAGNKIFENHQLYIQANGDKKELIYPTAPPETPLTTTPPADTLKKFICDKDSEEQLSSDGFPRKSCKLNENITMILTPEDLIKNNDNKEYIV